MKRINAVLTVQGTKPIKAKQLIFFAALIMASFTSSAQVVQQWVTIYNGSGNSTDHPNSLAIDGSNNIYVTGHSFNGTNNDYATIKYNTSGVQQWVAIYNGSGNGDDSENIIVVDDSGNVYVTGSSFNGTNDDYATIKYNTNGVQQWTAFYDAGGSGSDVANAIVVDDSGNVYVTGWGFSISSDYTTIKYNTSGVEQWVAIFNGGGNSFDIAKAIVLDDSGNVYVTGESMGSSTNFDYATIKYNASGVEQWVEIYNGSGNGADKAIAMAIDNSGNVYVTGASMGSVTSSDYATIKYNSSGVKQWTAIYNGSGDSSDFANDIAVDNQGNVFVTGFSYNGINYDYSTIKYNASGVEQWAALYNGSGNSTDQAFAIALDDSGKVYVTGASIGSSNNFDYATIKYNVNGVEQWAAVYNGNGNGDDGGYTIAIDNSDNVYVTGASFNGTNYDYTTIKYSQTPVGINDPGYSGAEQILLYPNPNTGEFTLEMNLTEKQDMQLTITSLLGQQVYSEKLNNIKGNYQKKIDLIGYAKGIYILKIISNEGVVNKKIVIQ